MLTFELTCGASSCKHARIICKYTVFTAIDSYTYSAFVYKIFFFLAVATYTSFALLWLYEGESHFKSPQWTVEALEALV